MDLNIKKSKLINRCEVRISGSKSESNRLLILQAMFPEITIKNISTAEDTQLLRRALNSSESEIDIHHAGTAMRFLTAYFALKPGRDVTLTGSPRMKQRPLGKLVDALKSLGAQITYLEKEGFPPVKITGSIINSSKVVIDAVTSSQFVTALMLMAPSLKNGLQITLQGAVTSKSYIQMTLSLLKELGMNARMTGDIISIDHCPENFPLKKHIFQVESDWSSASYFYSIIALSPSETEIKLCNFRKNSLQGDSHLVKIYKALGVETIFSEETILLKKTSSPLPEKLCLNLDNTPDIAQTIVVTCFGLGIGCELTGLHTLKIKETDRLTALQTELQNLGAAIETDDSSLLLKKGDISQIKNTGSVDTYDDHRMAMAFAPLALLIPLQIKQAEVVSKSYPRFWDDLKKIGFELKETHPCNE